MKKIMLFILLLIFTILSAQENVPSKQKDSINIRAMLESQIAKIKSKEEQKTTRQFIPDHQFENTKDENKEQQINSYKSQQESTPNGNSAGLETIYIKVFVLTDLGLGLILFLLWRRRNLKMKNVEKNWLKRNIKRLREDKVLARENKDLRKLRKQLRLEPVCNSNSPEYVSQFAKQQSISKGELLLAARLNSFKRVKDVTTGY